VQINTSKLHMFSRTDKNKFIGAPSWVRTQRRVPRSPEDSPCCRCPTTSRILGSLRPVYSREHMGGRNNRASWTGSLLTFILSQKAELRPRPLGIFPTRGKLASKEGSDPGTQVRSLFCTQGPSETSPHRRGCGLKKQQRFLKRAPLGLHLQPGGGSEIQT
jgi:hypothetical protein